MIVTYFGSYDPLYPRNILTMKAFLSLGWKVIECNDRGGGFRHYLNLIRYFVRKGKYADIIFVGVLGHYDVPLAWLLAKIYRKKIIFDAFYSLYDTYVADRKQVKGYSLAGLRFYTYDFLSAFLADKVILDTKENIAYFTSSYRLDSKKFYELNVTADPLLFRNVPYKKHQTFTIGFYGSFLPLHGVDKIIQAIELIQDVRFKLLILGEGPGLHNIKKQVNGIKHRKRVFFLKKVPYNKLPSFYRKIDLLVAGPFGSTSKTQRVLPQKIVESLSIGKPLIALKNHANTRILKEFAKDIFWSETNQPEKIHEQIMFFYNKSLRNNKKIWYNNFSDSNLSFDSFKKSITRIVAK